MVSGRKESQLCQKSLEIKQDDKFFTRIMSKDTSMANSSSRVYYGGASGSIPFMWESRPGTPKHTFSDSSIPPLTPPPSYFSTSKSISGSKQNSLFPKFITTSRKKSTHVSPSYSMSSSTTTTTSLYSNSSFSSSSSLRSSSRSSPFILNSRKRLWFSCSSSSIHDNEEEDDDDNVDKDDQHNSDSHSSILRSKGVNKGWFSMKNMKNAIFTVVGHVPRAN